MRDPRNPFRMRASEHIASDTTFLRLFGAGVLDRIERSDPFDRPVVFFRSAPGGGKTSLLRVFTPSCLINLQANRQNDEYRDLYDRMRKIGALDDNGPKLLGVMLSCAKNYADLDDLPWDSLHKKRLFFAFLNCRVLLTALRSALQLHNLEYPVDLSRLSLRVEPDDQVALNFDGIGRGDQVFEWAQSIEADISKTLDSFDPQPPAAPGHSGLHSLRLLHPDRFFLDDKPVASRVLVMFDDVHKLAFSQRVSLGTVLTENREFVPTWVAERLEALTSDEMLDLGSKQGRDYEDSAQTLELYWRGHRAKFDQTIMAIANKRVKEAQQVEVGSFSNCIQDSMDTPDMRTQLEKAAAEARIQVLDKWGENPRFEEWLHTTNTDYENDYDRGIAWQSLDILATRESQKTQLSFEAAGFALSEDQLHRRDGSGVKAAAELFFSDRFELPYYFGFSKLASMASLNIEQFLGVAGEMFEESSSAAVLRKSTLLPAQRQDAILRRTATQWWEQDVLRAIPFQTEVRRLVESIGRFSKSETYRPSAPYAPGVTGVSITMKERELLRDEGYLETRPNLHRLREVIAVCLAHNILEAELDRSQGYERRMLLYLNRLLCCHFGLPLQYGGWRAKRPDDLARWMVDGFRPEPVQEERLI